MSVDLSIIRILDPGLLVVRITDLSGYTERNVFIKTKTRKPRECALSGQGIAVGEMSWRMLTNGRCRMHRFKNEIIQGMINDYLQYKT